MPLIRNGTLEFVIEEGQSYRGWTLEKIIILDLQRAFGTHLLYFRRGELVRHISNVHWVGEPAFCSDGQLGILECPKELLLFAQRNTKLFDRHQALAED